MLTTIDAAGRVVIPKALREQAGLVPGAELTIEIDGAGLRIQAAAGEGFVRKGRFLVIPASAEPSDTGRVDDELVERLRRDGQR